MKSKYSEIGVCGLSCRLCPAYVIKTKSRCPGCKTEWRLAGPCSILRCAVKRKVEFCGLCEESKTCEKWKKHREMGKHCDSFKCYKKLDEDVAFIQKNGLSEFRKSQKIREKLLWKMLNGFNEGRSKSYYCLVSTILEVSEIEKSLQEAKEKSKGLTLKEKAKLLHSIFEKIAQKKGYYLKLRLRK
ncbi:MAG: DUF3795 domain-containing protein [Candidatus Pacebacteria bacterium]|nr:DUF3795 domain-containing protein [Candidatus Paceibacterota bacterium]